MAATPNTDAEDFARMTPQRIVLDEESWNAFQELLADDTATAETPTWAQALAQEYPEVDLAVGSDTPVDVVISAYGIGEHLTVTVPATWAARIKALEPVTQFGPNYQRRVVDTLVDVNHQVRTGALSLAESGLEYCERVAGI